MAKGNGFNYYQFDGAHDAHKLVGLVTGFGGSASDLEQAALDFTAHGYDSLIYELDDPAIFLDGDHSILLETTANIRDDFQQRALGYDAVRLSGVSLGGAIAANVQKGIANPERGYFAATGSSVVDVVNDPWFNTLVYTKCGKSPRRAFMRNGYDRERLSELWSEFQEPPATPFALALGGIDRIIKRRKVMTNVRDWRDTGHDIQVVSSPYSDHIGTIRRFNHTVVDLVFNQDRRIIQPSPQRQPNFLQKISLHTNGLAQTA